jgi:hypothetical protein
MPPQSQGYAQYGALPLGVYCDFERNVIHSSWMVSYFTPVLGYLTGGQADRMTIVQYGFPYYSVLRNKKGTGLSLGISSHL